MPVFEPTSDYLMPAMREHLLDRAAELVSDRTELDFTVTVLVTDPVTHEERPVLLGSDDLNDGDIEDSPILISVVHRLEPGDDSKRDVLNAMFDAHADLIKNGEQNEAFNLEALAAQVREAKLNAEKWQARLDETLAQIATLNERLKAHGVEV